MKRKRKRETPTARNEERRSRKRIFHYALVISLTAILLSPAVFLSFPIYDIDELRTVNPRTTALILQRTEEALQAGRTFKKRQRWVPLENICVHLPNAVIVSEDASFYTHSGFDTHEIRESIRKNWREKRLARGGSTISQQLVKNLFLGTSKNFRRKAIEAFTTWRLERTLSKKRILEIYLNVIEWGDGIYGAEAAAHHYFDVSAAGLNPRQAALLASAIPSPRRYDPGDPGPFIKRQADLTLERMHARGLLNDEAYTRWK